MKNKFDLGLTSRSQGRRGHRKRLPKAFFSRKPRKEVAVLREVSKDWGSYCPNPGPVWKRLIAVEELRLARGLVG
jgi:hypothetical protein